MFHELGHCVLDRPHDDDRAVNTRRPASLMSTYLLSSYWYKSYYEEYMYELFHF
jgi:hypothetical protein